MSEPDHSSEGPGMKKLLTQANMVGQQNKSITVIVWYFYIKDDNILKYFIYLRILLFYFIFFNERNKF